MNPFSVQVLPVEFGEPYHQRELHIAFLDNRRDQLRFAVFAYGQHGPVKERDVVLPLSFLLETFPDLANLVRHVRLTLDKS